MNYIRKDVAVKRLDQIKVILTKADNLNAEDVVNECIAAVVGVLGVEYNQGRLNGAIDDVQTYASYIRHLASCTEDAAAEDGWAEAVGKILALCEAVDMMAGKIESAAEHIVEELRGWE